MTDRNCDTCENYKERQPDIRAFTKTEFDRARKDKETWERVWFSTITDGWQLASAYPEIIIQYGGWEGSCSHGDYGLPRTDPFWPEHWDGEPCKLPLWSGCKDSANVLRFEYTGKYREPHKGEWYHDSGDAIDIARIGFKDLAGDYEAYWILRAIPIEQTVTVKVDPLSEFKNAVDNRPLVKVWAIDKTGDVEQYSFRGQPNWERIKRENKDAEAIVVTTHGGMIKPSDTKWTWMVLD